MTNNTPLAIPNIDLLIERYQLFLIDQFGVLHDGSTLYPGAVDALKRIRESNRRTVIISNSGKRANINVERLEKIGIDQTSYHRLVTSGEVAFTVLQRKLRDGELPADARCYLLANDGDTSAIDGLPLQRVDSIDTADVVLLSGIRGDFQDLEYYDVLFRPALERRVLMICTNPDKQALQSGKTVMGAGRVAEQYQSAGGTVLWIGKPYADIYQYILESEGFAADREQVICIGDSIEHDICGGQQQQLGTALVGTGIYQGLGSDELEKRYRQYAARPDYILPSLC